MYETVRHSGPDEFLTVAEEWLLRAEDRHNLILSLTAARLGNSEDDAFYGTVLERGAVVGCALRTPPHKVLITELPVDAAPSLARALAERYEHIPAVLGPPTPAEAVAMAWVAERGGGWRPGMEQRLYRLDEVTPPPPVSGACRMATPDDTELAVEWAGGFARDAGQRFTLKREAVEGWIDRRRLFVWEDERPRSIAVAHGRTPRGVRVGYVYTPPESRRHGYASALVAEVSQSMLDAGSDFCVLYTDQSNPTSNAIYRRLGYRPIADVRDYDLIPEEAV